MPTYFDRYCEFCGRVMGNQQKSCCEDREREKFFTDVTDNQEMIKQKGVLWGTKTYLIGTMQYANGRDWRNYTKEELKDRGITVFDPYYKPFLDGIDEDEQARNELHNLMEQGDFDEVAKRMRRVRALDLRLCDIVDFAIAHILPSVASWGSAEELTTCVRMKKVLFLSVEGGIKKTPLWILGMLPVKYIFNTVEDSIALIKDIDDGRVEIDSERWKLLKPEFR